MEDIKKIEQEIEDAIKIWEKNRQALFDMAGLMFELRKSSTRTITTASLFYRVLDNLQDEEIIINYKGKSLSEEYDKLYDLLKKKEKYYSEIAPELSKKFQSIRSRNMDSYLFNSSRYFESRNNNDKVSFHNSSYNLMQRLACNDEVKWIREVLISKIPKSVRLSMLNDITKYKSRFNYLDNLVSEESYLYPDSIYSAIGAFDDCYESKKKCNKEIMELFREWEKDYITETEKYKIVNEYPVCKIKFFQTKGIIDFTRDTIYKEEDGREVAVAAQIYVRNKNILSIKPFYDNESYQKLNKEIRENTDKFLIWHVAEECESHLTDLIKLTNFAITDKNISEIITALSIRKEVAPVAIDGICKAVERKAKTPKEYKKALTYTKLIKESLDSNKLRTKRQELTLRLARLNDTLQETTPGKIKIKSIDFSSKK